MVKLAKRISLVSGFTVVSRLLGLVRDILFFSCFGISLIGDAFILAFTIPNLFRRMLGEGTLSSAFIPVYSDTNKELSKHHSDQILNQVVTRLILILGLIVVVICFFSWLAHRNGWHEETKWSDALFLNSIIFPYVIAICISAILVGALNVHGKFFAGAFSPVILNLCMIGCLFTFSFYFSEDGLFLAVCLCVAVLVGGFFQLILPWFQLRNQVSWKWRFDLSDSPGLERIKGLFFVGVFGAAVGQINILVSRFLAYSLEDKGALSYLFLSARLIELPLGVFAVSISTVFFPQLSQYFSSGNKNAYTESFSKGFRLTLGVLFPASVGMSFLADSILNVLFQWGEFGRGDVEVAAEILRISCLALPFYGIAAYFVKVFHSQKDMRIPLRAAVISFFTNLLLSLYLMQKYGMHGLAWANVGSSVVQTIYLGIKLKEIPTISFFWQKSFSIVQIILSSLVMFLFLYLINEQNLFGEDKWGNILKLVLLIPLGVLVYGLILFLLKFPDFQNLRNKIP